MWKRLLYTVQPGAVISRAELVARWFPVTGRPVICRYLPVWVV